MSEGEDGEMNLPHAAVSWETVFLSAAACFALGALLSAAAGRRGRRGAAAAGTEIRAARGAAEEVPPGEPAGEFPETLSDLAGRLWLAETPGAAQTAPALFDPGPRPATEFDREETADFWREEVLPLRDVLEKTGELPVIEKVLRALDREGLCPSVVSGDSRSSFRPAASRFGKISLLDHSLRTARRMREIHDSRHSEKLLLGKHLLAALAHDVGKIERFRKPGRYLKDGHAEASAAVLSEWIAEFGAKGAPRELMGVVDAVRNHHRSSEAPGELLSNLRSADSAARGEEFSGGRSGRLAPAGDAPRGEPPPWLVEDAPRVLRERVLPAINVPDGEREPFVWAFSATNGVVYVDPHRLLDSVREHMEAEDAADARFFDSSAELEAKLMVTNALKSLGWVGGEVKDGYYAAFWNYRYGGKKSAKPGFWIPVFAEAFGVELGELEKRRTGDLRGLGSVSPRVTRGKRK